MSDTTSGTDSVITTVITTTSVSLTTSPTTTVIVTDTSTSTLETSSAAPPTTSVVTAPTSTTVVEATTTPPVVNVTATTTLTPSQATTTPTSASPTVVFVTSTQPGQTTATQTSIVSANRTSSSTSSSGSALSASGNGSGSGGGGLSSGGKIAIAVIIPIVVIAAAFLIGFFLWRKRKARKTNEELRKNEMAEYGFNPNSDPTVVGAGTAYTDNVSEAQEDTSGYRGWGATSSNRKASTTLGSNGKVAAGGLATSESSSQPGGYHGSPNAPSDAYSTDPLMNGHPESGDGVGALGAGAGLNRNRSGAAGVRRGPSNASSTYSEGHVSELSSDNQSVPGPYYQEEVPYNIYNDAAPSHGPYGDGSYGGSNNQPVIRDVQARRNTRIERAPAFPATQGGGISQNF